MRRGDRENEEESLSQVGFPQARQISWFFGVRAGGRLKLEHDALKLRVAEGFLTTVLSPTGDQLTSVDVTMEVIQCSSLSVGLPEGGESVNSIRQPR